MSLNELNPNSDLSDEGGRWQLQVTLDKISRAISNLRLDQDSIKDRIPPAAVIGLPLANTSATNGRAIGDIFSKGTATVPTNAFLCDGTAKSRTTYQKLFDVIGTTYGVGDGSTTFNLPDSKGRCLVGSGDGDATGHTNHALGTKYGEETHVLTAAELATHNHPAGTHTHYDDHIHAVGVHANNAAGAYEPLGILSNTGALGTATTGAKSSGAYTSASTGDVGNSTGGGNAHENRTPSLTVARYIQYDVDPGSVALSWGQVQGSWAFDDGFPLTGVTNQQKAHSSTQSGATVRATAANGTDSATSSEIKITGLLRVPQTFTGWAHSALKLDSQIIGITGASGTCVVTLRIFNPLSASAVLATSSRTVTVATGTISESAEKTLVITAQGMGDAWAPGYPLKFELEFEFIKTFTACDIEVGELQILWE